MKHVQIDIELFHNLCDYHLLEDDTHADEIAEALETKLNKLVAHEIYTKSQVAETQDERAEAWEKYISRRREY